MSNRARFATSPQRLTRRFITTFDNVSGVFRYAYTLTEVQVGEICKYDDWRLNRLYEALRRRTTNAPLRKRVCIINFDQLLEVRSTFGTRHRCHSPCIHHCVDMVDMWLPNCFVDTNGCTGKGPGSVIIRGVYRHYKGFSFL